MTEQPENEPPEVETRQVVKWITTPTSQLLRQQPPPAAPAVEKPLRPRLRPPVPVLTVLDDGSLETGDDIRLRSDVFVIGRDSGDCVLPHDTALSARHAEIRHVDDRGQKSWRLIDLDSFNGTFARVAGGVIYPETVIMIGLRQFQLTMPFGQEAGGGEAGTRQLDVSESVTSSWPTLTEKTKRDDGLSFPLREAKVTIGRQGGGCDIEIDDPHLANHHATLEQTFSGQWRVKAQECLNGTWLSLRRAKLTECCFFRCGEQVFRFVIP